MAKRLILVVFGITLGLVISVPATADLCNGNVCKTVCGESCAPPYCSEGPNGGECSCEVTEKNLGGGFTTYICKTFGGNCEFGCPDPGEPPEPPPARRKDAPNIVFLPNKPMKAALADYPDVLLLLEHELRGGTVPGHYEMNLMLSRPVPGFVKKDPSLNFQRLKEGFQKPREARLVYDAEGESITFEMRFEKEGLVFSGEIWNIGEAGIVRIERPDMTKSDDFLSW